MVRRQRWVGAALASLALVLAIGGCDDPPPKVQVTAPRVSATSVASAPEPSNTATKLDPPPRATDPESRPRQQQVGSELVIDAKGKWDADCLIHRACKVKPKALDVCPPGSDAPAWSTLPGKAEHFTDPHLAIKGQLVMTDQGFSSAVGCKQGQCCNGVRVDMALAGPPYDLDLVGLGCAGDESRQCCPFSARGEEVIATGILNYSGGRLFLTSPKLCRLKTD